MKKFKELLKYIQGNLHLVFFAIFFANLVALFSTLVPVFIKYAVDNVISKVENSNEVIIQYINKFISSDNQINNLILICIIILISTGLRCIFKFLQDSISAKVAQNSSKKARENLFRHISLLPYNYHVNSNTGDIIQRCTSDIETIQEFLSYQVAIIGEIFFTIIYIIAAMYLINFEYMIIAVLFVPVIAFYTYKFFRNIQTVFNKIEESEAVLTNVAHENLTGIRVVKAFSAESFEIEKFDKSNIDFKNNICHIIDLMSKFWSSVDFLTLFQYSVVILSGIYFAANEIITVGTVIAFISLSGMLIWPVRQFGEIMASLGKTFVSLKRIHAVFETQVENEQKSTLKPKIKGNITIKNLSFSYNKESTVLKDISIDIKKGQTIGIMGQTGSGKSTIVHLLLRLFDYKYGSISLDGVELKKIDRKWIRQNISLILQESYFFSKSIYENIKLGNEHTNKSDILNVIKISQLEDTISAFKDGYNTILGVKGITLSGGQRQRVSIAQGLIKNSPIIIFDDSLSALDSDTDRKIRFALKENNQYRTTIIISHRINSVIDADNIFILDKGAIVEKGSHFELLKNTNGLYRKTYEMQLGQEENII